MSAESIAVNSTNSFFEEALQRSVDLVTAPKEYPEMLWTIVPMLISLIFINLYFGRNKDESLGWNTAFGNSIALIFISVSVIRGIYIEAGLPFWASPPDGYMILLPLFLMMYGILLSMITFFHWMPESVAFFIMGSVPINVTAYSVVVIANAHVPLDLMTLVACAMIFITVLAVATLLRGLVPASLESKVHLLERRKSLIQKRIDDIEESRRGADDNKRAKLHLKILGHKNKIEQIEKEITSLKSL